MEICLPIICSPNTLSHYGWWRKHCTTSRRFCCLQRRPFSSQPPRTPAFNIGMRSKEPKVEEKESCPEFCLRRTTLPNIKARGCKGEA